DPVADRARRGAVGTALPGFADATESLPDRRPHHLLRPITDSAARDDQGPPHEGGPVSGRSKTPCHGQSGARRPAPHSSRVRVNGRIRYAARSGTTGPRAGKSLWPRAQSDLCWAIRERGTV